MLGIGGVGLFCGRGHLQTREIKGNQGKSREIKENQGKSREIKENQGKQGKQGNPRRDKESRGNKGIFIVRESYVYEGMFMYGCVCFFG